MATATLIISGIAIGISAATILINMQTRKMLREES